MFILNTRIAACPGSPQLIVNYNNKMPTTSVYFPLVFKRIPKRSQQSGVHITSLQSYSVEYQEMVFGTHPRHSSTRNIGSYETQPVSQRFFASPFFFIKLQQLDHGAFDYLTKGTLRSADFAQFSSVCALHSAHERTFHCAYHSFRATAHRGATFFEKKPFSSVP